MTTDSPARVLKNALLNAGLSLDASSKCPCKICGGIALLFDLLDFNRVCHPDNYPFGLSGVPIYYYRCEDCGLVFTRAFDRFQSKAWSQHIYNSDYYATVDTDYELFRPTLNAEVVKAVCFALGKTKVLGVDYGGGNGILSRLLRRSDINYFTYDPYGSSDTLDGKVGKFSVVSSFEVLEHTVDPLGTFTDMLQLAADRFVLLASTQCSDGLIDSERRLSWNYVAPRNGHVTIYSMDSLIRMARSLSLDYLGVSRGLHLFGRGLRLRPLKYVAGAVKFKQRIHAILAS